MRRAIHDARERELDQRARVVARLQQIRQPLLAQAIELGRRKGGAQRDVRHQRQRIAELRRPAPRAAPPNNRTSSSS